MSTIKEIAYLSGVSRGTVDRVLNNRGAVNPETAKKVRSIAEALNYSPNRLGKNLAITKKKLKFGYVLFSNKASNPFFEEVTASIEKRALELAEYGVTVEIRHAKIDDPHLQVRLIDELMALETNGLVVTPINHPLVAEKIQALTNKGIPVVTANTDIENCGRIAYVGSNYYKSGETAGGLMALITGGKANIGIVLGSPNVLCHQDRVKGFQHILSTRYPDMKIVSTIRNHDDDLESYAVTKQLLTMHPETDALFLAAAGVSGACKAVRETGLAGRIKIVSFDTVPATTELVQNGVISATIGQQPAVQGKKPLDILLDYLGMDAPPSQEFFYTNIEIKIRENLD